MLLPLPAGAFQELGARSAIWARKYRLLLQFEAFGPGGKRIDFVVEGLRARLAVECDGDWHGPERHDEDMARQPQLERCGWSFWRVRGSTFCRDPEKALKPLWKRLSERGILPTDRSVVEVAATIPPVQRPPEVGAVCSQGRLLFITNQEDVPAPNARNIDDLQDVEIRTALVACVPDEGPIARERLFIEAAKSFGYEKSIPLESDSQNLRPDASLPEAKAIYRISGVMAGDFAAAYCQAAPILPEEAKSHIGENVSVRGMVEQVSVSKKGHPFLNFGGNYPNQIFAGFVLCRMLSP